MQQRLYKVRGTTLEEAYRKMRGKFGAEAVALSTHQVTEGGVFGLFGQKLVEITASVPVPSEPGARRGSSAVERKYAEHSKAGSAPPREENVAEYEELIRNAQRRMQGQSPPPPRTAPPSTGAKPSPGPARASAAGGQAAPHVLPFPNRRADAEACEEDLRREVSEIREMMQVLYSESPGAGLPAEFAPHYRALVNRGVSRKAAAALIGAVVRNSDLAVLREARVFTERLYLEIRKSISVTGGIALQAGSQCVAALCGATGVGKTTNLAKLAAQFSVHERARVAMLTSDTYRIAAPEQLRVYANIIGVPLRIANDASEIAQARREFHGYDLMLMDTAGGSQFNLEQINDLKGLLFAAKPHETILVLSANTQLADMRNMISNFSCLRPTSLMFTKLDETRQYGVMLSVLIETGLPLSFLSVGQNVPDDIRIASTAMVANLALEGRDKRG